MPKRLKTSTGRLSSWPASSGCGPLVAHCHLGLTRLYHRTGDQSKAEEHLAVATAMCREMNVSGWVENV